MSETIIILPCRNWCARVWSVHAAWSFRWGLWTYFSSENNLLSPLLLRLASSKNSVLVCSSRELRAIRMCSRRALRSWVSVDNTGFPVGRTTPTTKIQWAPRFVAEFSVPRLAVRTAGPVSVRDACFAACSVMPDVWALSVSPNLFAAAATVGRTPMAPMAAAD